jgi:hypothetical protein
VLHRQLRLGTEQRSAPPPGGTARVRRPHIPTYSWNFGSGTANPWTTSGDWTDVNAGTTGVVPGAGDTALITQAGSYSITWTGRGQVVPVGSLLLDAPNATLTWAGGRTLAVGNTTTLNAGLITDGGLLSTATFIQNGGSFNDAGTLAVGSAATLAGGAMTIGGTLATGTLRQTGGSFSQTGSLAASAGITLSGGTGTIAAGATLGVTGGGLAVGGSAALVLNGGTAAVETVVGGISLSGGSLAIANTVTADSLAVTGGSLTLANGAAITLTGSAAFSGGAETVGGGSLQTLGGGLVVGNGASLAVNGGELALAGATTLDAAVSVGGGTLYVTTGGLLVGTGGALTESSGNVTAVGTTRLTAGSASLGGGVFFVSTGGLQISGGGTLQASGVNATIAGGATIAAGSATVSAGTLFVADSGLAIGSLGALAVTGGFAEIAGGATLTGGGASVSAGTLYVADSGLSLATGTALTVNGGSATLAGGLVVSGGTATIGGGTLYASSGGLRISNAGTVGLSGGSATIAGGATITAGSALVSGGTLYVSGGGLSIGNGGALSASGGSTSIVGGLTSSGTLTLGTLGTLAADTFAITAGRFTDAANTVAISGQASFTGGSATLSAGVFSAGTVTVGAATLSLAGGGLAGGAGGIALAGTLAGYGIVQGAFSGSGSVLASGGTLELLGALGDTAATYRIADSAGSVLRLDGAVTAPQVTVGFAGSHGVLELHDLTTQAGHDSANFAGTVSGMMVGGSATAATTAINVQGATGVSARLSGSTLTLLDATGTIASIALTSTTGAALNGAHVDWQADAALGGTDIFLSTAVCFAAGTRLLTPRGAAAVEDLAIGDSVVTLVDGRHDVQPVQWIGTRRLDLAAHPNPALVAPVRVQRDALGPGVPHRDLLLSPDHCLLLDGRLVPVKLLLNGMTIVQERQAQSVQYVHVELARHGVLLAEGAAAESYLDTGNRGFFSNAAGPAVLHPAPETSGLAAYAAVAAAPFALDAVSVRPIWQALAWRAALRGLRPPAPATTRDPELVLEADGRRIRPVAVEGRRHVFMLPAGPRRVRLLSRADIPADHTPCLDDFRRLGVRVDRIALQAGAERTEIAPDHPGLRRGWHPPERAADGGGLWRWTDGAAELALDTGRPLRVEVEVGDTMTYRVAGADAAAGAAGPGAGVGVATARAAA